MTNETNVTWHDHQVSRAERERINGHKGCVIWFTGLSGSGKSTVANVLDHQLSRLGVNSAVLDGDNVRHGLNAGPGMLTEAHGEDFARRFGLGFSAIDREENIRRIGAVAQLFAQAGLISLTAFISPYRRDRDMVRATMGPGDFIEVFVDTPLEVCEARDPKGLYKKARAGELKGFTGIDDPYEAPQAPELTLLAGEKSPEALAAEVIDYLVSAPDHPPDREGLTRDGAGRRRSPLPLQAPPLTPVRRHASHPTVNWVFCRSKKGCLTQIKSHPRNRGHAFPARRRPTCRLPRPEPQDETPRPGQPARRPPQPARVAGGPS